MDSTHQALHAIVDRYIDSVQFERWPAPLRAQGDRAIESACQYGLGLIRMLAEFHVCEGLADAESVRLAVALAAACKQVKESMSDAVTAPLGVPVDGGATRRTGAHRISGKRLVRTQ